MFGDYSIGDLGAIFAMQGFAGLILFSVYVLMALGLAVIFGQMGVINMAHGEFMILGAYVTWLTSSAFQHYLPALFPGYFFLAMVLAFEGGWSDDPFDPGGPTNRGITLATFARVHGIEITASNRARLIADLRVIPDTLVAHIYRERYWRPAHCPELPAALAFFHFDVAVNMGVGTAIRMLQDALDVEIDGEIGPITRAAARTNFLASTLERYADLRRARYRSLSGFWRFGRGWLTRCDTALARAIALSRNPPAPTATTTPVPPTSPSNPKGKTPMSDAPIFTNESFGKSAGSPAATKWWGGSLTIWGALLTAVTTVAPALFAALGIDLPIDLIQRLGSDVVTLVQAIGGLVGTILTIVGRLRASTFIARRPLTLRI